MHEPISFDPPPAELLSILESATPGVARPGASARRLEFSCRGDRVRLDLVAPGTSGPHPTLLVQPAPGGPRGPEGLAGADAWLAAGVALASVDLPLFGARRSAKLSRQLEETIAGAARGEPVARASRLLWTEFTRQAVMELRRTLDVLEHVWESRDAPVAYAGSGIAGSLGALLCAVDERPRGAVLHLTGGGFGPEEIDPVFRVAAIAPRPLLLVNRDEHPGEPGAPAVPRSAAKALAEAAGENARAEWQSGPDPGLLEIARDFLSPLLS